MKSFFLDTNLSKLNVFILFILLIGCKGSKDEQAQIQTDIKQPDSLLLSLLENDLTFFILSDWGRNGYYHQKDVSEAMGTFSDTYFSPDFIISCGDNFQVNGVGSTQDPLWYTNFESIYTHPSLLVDWYPVLGNHDYKGSTDALIQYSKISRRWKMEDRYYTLVKTINDSSQARFIFIDTPALIESYRNQPDKYPDACLQDEKKQLNWLNNVLSEAKEDWIFVAGHHPVYSASQKHGDTPELIAKLQSLFEEYGVDMYFCGHDHDFQHLKPTGATVDYIVSGTGATVRESAVNENSIVSFSESGFTGVSIKNDTLYLNFIKSDLSRLYTMQQYID